MRVGWSRCRCGVAIASKTGLLRTALLRFERNEPGRNVGLGGLLTLAELQFGRHPELWNLQMAATVAKSFWGDEQKFLEPLMRFKRGDVRDHIVHPKSTTVLRSGATVRFGGKEV